MFPAVCSAAAQTRAGARHRLSHDVLRFTTQPVWDSGNAPTAPIHVARWHDAGYIIAEGDYLSSTVPFSTCTPSATDAAARVERLPAGRIPRSRASPKIVHRGLASPPAEGD